jgi:hypothetical protein
MASMKRNINDIVADPALKANLEARFWPKVDRRDPDECWPWIAKATHPFGYGRMTAGRGNHLKAHRIAYALEHGSVPDGESVLHECDSPPCCNPRHLFLGSQQKNIEDMRGKGRGSMPPKHVGDNHPRAKYTAEQGRRIAGDPRPAAAVAKEYNVSAKTVYLLRRGQARIT